MEKPHRDWGLLIWVAFAMLVLVILTVIISAWAVRHALANGQHLSSKQRELVLAVSEFPGMVRDALREITGIFGRSPTTLTLERSKIEKPYWIRRFPSPDDPGFLLFSGLDPYTRHSAVKLIRISDGKALARWTPDWDAIYQHITEKKFEQKGSPYNARALHPLLLSDGDIVFNTLNAMVRVSRCDGRPIWVLDEIVHHSNELDDEGMIWTAGVSWQGFADNEWLRERVRDDAVLGVSEDGRVLKRYSMAKMLRDNELKPLLFGTGGNILNTDPVHLNQVRKAERDTRYWKRGDLLLSARNLSAVLIYRPSTGKIVWYRIGPWMNQHDADFLDDHRISVFDNNVFDGSPPDQPFMTKGEINQVFIYDFATGEATQPYADLLAQTRPVTFSEGRARVLPDGGLFVEESNLGRILRFTRDRLLWSFVNDYDAKRIGLLNWSRYLTAEEAAPVLRSLAARPCPVAAAVVKRAEQSAPAHPGSSELQR